MISKEKARLNAIKHTRERTPIPSAKTFDNDKKASSKQRRREGREIIRKEMDGGN